MYKKFSLLRRLSRRYKLLILSCVDAITALICWIIFGPPFSIMIATNFEVSLAEIINQNYLNFLFQHLLHFYIFFIQVFIDQQ